jgi:hypothetical protein
MAWGVMGWIQDQVEDTCEHGNEASGFIVLGSFWVNVNPPASQEDHSPMELDNWWDHEIRVLSK